MSQRSSSRAVRYRSRIRTALWTSAGESPRRVLASRRLGPIWNMRRVLRIVAEGVEKRKPPVDRAVEDPVENFSVCSWPASSLGRGTRQTLSLLGPLADGPEDDERPGRLAEPLGWSGGGSN